MEESIEVDFSPSHSTSVGSGGGDDEAYDDQYLEDSTTNYENGNDDDFYDNPLEQKKRPDKATKVIWCTRALVIVVLVLSAATAATLTYVFLEGDEHEDFSATYKNNALEITTVAQQNADNIFSSIRHFAAIYTSHMRQQSLAAQPEYPLSFLTLPDFESFAQNTRQVAGCTFLAYSPLLKSSSQRLEWETYSIEHQSWIHDSLIQAFPDYAGHPADVQPIPDIVWRMNDVTGLPEIDPGPPPFLPLWQVSPPPPPNMTSKINVDLLSASMEFTAAADYSLQTAEPTLSKPFDIVHLFGNDSAPTTASVLVEPVLSSFDEDATVLGAISAVLPWDVYFSNLLPQDSEAVVVVVESCGTNNTFVLEGPQATYMGPGDLHDHSYNSWEVFSHLVLARNTADERFRRQCVHALHVFPTSELQAAHETDTPLLYTLIVMSIFVFAIVIFFIYDLVATIRQNKTKAEADRTDAIIAQIFPAMIREQLFMSGALATGGGGENKNGKKDWNRTSLRELGGKNNHRGRRPSLGSREHSSESLLDFMQKGREAEVRRQQASRAIADLYPETTIMFADIPGFTAWSSIREPTHVFMLLEAVFQTFDEIANRRRVFKVETVGDCFVAACGVPDPCSDHAVVMARFARECMKQFHQTLLKLELTLGPDTCDLGLRVGLHSGPVTAGVLRGDRARFQLFGDCMNTTARVQTTGQRDCIHVSEQTASLLTLAGKRKWLIPREDQVQAKGKGYLKTFWLKTKRISAGEGSQSNTTDSDGSETETDGNLSFSENSSSMTDVELIDSEAILKSMDEKLAGKRKSSVSQKPAQQGINERLVMWNAELLAQLLRQIIARRGERQPKDQNNLHLVAAAIGHGKMVVEETAEIIELPDFDAHGSTRRAADVELSPEILEQLRDYVATIAGMYRDNPFHNFEHASHVTMSVSKLLSRIVAPQIAVNLSEIERKEQLLHDHTYGITSDPLTQFAVVLSALIHDVDHRGIPNFLLAKEDMKLADSYQCKSIAEQNSVDKAWEALMDDKYEELRDCIFCNTAELKRFRQLLVNSVIATDIFDKELGTLRKNRWKKAFEEKEEEDTREDINRKATIVIEHIIQASDVSHTMQHWQVYLKWNSRLFTEMYEAFLAGRSDKDPSVGWYQGELGFFDNYIIPLAKKLKQCGVFGVSSDEYLNYAMHNRREWANNGEQVVADMVARAHEEYNTNNKGAEM